MQEFLRLVHEMSPYLLFGFLIAGLLHAFVPPTLYTRYLSAGNFRSILLAALFGIPLPLCSCGVIPTAMSLRREGASRGATVSFLIATPQTGIDSILATFSLLGLPFAIVRPIAALATALFGGSLVNISERKAPSSPVDVQGGMIHSAVTAAACTDGCAAAAADHRPDGFIPRLRLALRYAFVDMMEDIGRWLLIGLLVAGAITVFVPSGWLAVFSDNSLLSIVFVLLLAIPMYLCATGSIPIAVALMLKGLTPGAALVLLMAGPACNVASILVVHKVLGRRTLIVYLSAIIFGAVGFALAIDHFLPAAWFVPTIAPELHADCCTPATPLYQWAATGLLALLLTHALLVQPLRRRILTAPSAQAENPTSCCSSSASQTSAPTRRYAVRGMNCHHCRTSVERALSTLAGVEAVVVSLERSEALVTGTADPAQILAAVTGLGFEAEEC